MNIVATLDKFNPRCQHTVTVDVVMEDDEAPMDKSNIPRQAGGMNIVLMRHPVWYATLDEISVQSQQLSQLGTIAHELSRTIEDSRRDITNALLMAGLWLEPGYRNNNRLRQMVEMSMSLLGLATEDTIVVLEIRQENSIALSEQFTLEPCNIDDESAVLSALRAGYRAAGFTGYPARSRKPHYMWR